MIIDHPGLGAAIAAGAIQPLRRLVPREAAEEWKATSFVPTWDSYMVGGQPWALPVDAATQVSVFRPDLLPGGGAIIGFDDRVPAAGGGAGGQGQPARGAEHGAGASYPVRTGDAGYLQGDSRCGGGAFGLRGEAGT
jgi:hypothetical protein